jgi:hypothetical protein
LHEPYGEPAYREALDSTPDDPRLLDPLNGLAEIYRAEGKTGEAEPLLNQSLRITEKVFGPSHENTAGALKSLAIFYQLQGKYSMALGRGQVVGSTSCRPEDASVVLPLIIWPRFAVGTIVSESYRRSRFLKMGLEDRSSSSA